jgi:hypothetical protein
MAREDFVTVRLTEHGERMAQGKPVSVAAGQHNFVFQPGEVRDDITRAFDWEKCLKDLRVNDELMFEIVPDAEAK